MTNITHKFIFWDDMYDKALKVLTHNVWNQAAERTVREWVLDGGRQTRIGLPIQEKLGVEGSHFQGTI